MSEYRLTTLWVARDKKGKCLCWSKPTWDKHGEIVGFKQWIDYKHGFPSVKMYECKQLKVKALGRFGNHRRCSIGRKETDNGLSE